MAHNIIRECGEFKIENRIHTEIRLRCRAKVNAASALADMKALMAINFIQIFSCPMIVRCYLLADANESNWFY